MMVQPIWRHQPPIDHGPVCEPSRRKKLTYFIRKNVHKLDPTESCTKWLRHITWHTKNSVMATRSVTMMVDNPKPFSRNLSHSRIDNPGNNFQTLKEGHIHFRSTILRVENDQQHVSVNFKEDVFIESSNIIIPFLAELHSQARDIHGNQLWTNARLKQENTTRS